MCEGTATSVSRNKDSSGELAVRNVKMIDHEVEANLLESRQSILEEQMNRLTTEMKLCLQSWYSIDVSLVARTFSYIISMCAYPHLCAYIVRKGSGHHTK